MQEQQTSSTTPGPWRAQAVNPREYIVWKQGYEGGGAVCRVDRSSRFLVGPLKESGGADARLIAAAPDLLEAAKAVTSQTAGMGDKLLEAAIQQLEAAIEKAEGRS